jgi:hypothetical protein
MGRPVLLADVGLDLDDASSPPAGGSIPEQPAAEERPPQLERRQLEDVASGFAYRGITVT